MPRINANGTQMHTNYQIDGNTNTEKDRAGLRLLPVSEVMVKEVKVITSGFAPEFGQTTGMVYNAVTPSGTNQLTGSASFRFRRQGLLGAAVLPRRHRAASPTPTSTTAPRPWAGRSSRTGRTSTSVTSTWTATCPRDRVITVSAGATRRASASVADGHPGRRASSPPTQTVNFLLGKVDHQLRPATSCRRATSSSRTARPTTSARAGRSTPSSGRPTSTTGWTRPPLQLDLVHRLRPAERAARAVRAAPPVPHRRARAPAAGPAITVTRRGQLRAARRGTSSDAGFDFNQGIWQVLDNFSWIRGRHNFKVGVDAQFIDDDRREHALPALHLPERGRLPRRPETARTRASYTSFAQLLGDPAVELQLELLRLLRPGRLQASAQSFKVLFGIRYDLLQGPGRAAVRRQPAVVELQGRQEQLRAAGRASRGRSTARRARCCARPSGIMYEPPLLNFYEDAIQRNGDPAHAVSVTLEPDQRRARRPSRARSPTCRPASRCPLQSIVAMDPDFSTQYARAHQRPARARAHATTSRWPWATSTRIGRNMPVLVDTNLIPTGPTLGDGRPIYSTAVTPRRASTPPSTTSTSSSRSARGTYNAFTAT